MCFCSSPLLPICTIRKQVSNILIAEVYLSPLSSLLTNPTQFSHLPEYLPWTALQVGLKKKKERKKGEKKKKKKVSFTRVLLVNYLPVESLHQEFDFIG